MYEFAGYLKLTYLSSYTYIVSNWSLQGWTYFSNTPALALSAFSVLAGVLQRLTHRYKFLQGMGLCISIVGYGLLLSPHGMTATTHTALLAASTVVTGLGGAFSGIASQVRPFVSSHRQFRTVDILPRLQPKPPYLTKI